MTKTKKIFSFLAIFFALTLNLAAQNKFAGKTYISTSVMADGVDIIPIMNAMGINDFFKIVFKTDKLCDFIMTSPDTGEEETNADCSYSIDKSKKTVKIKIEGEEQEFTYSDDFNKFSYETTSFEIDNQTMPLSIVFTEETLARKSQNITVQEEEVIDYGSVKKDIFAGNSYSFTKLNINGQDVTAMIKLSGMDIKIKLTFTNDKQAILESNLNGSMDSEAASYTIDYSGNTITFTSDTTDTATYYNKGKNIKLTTQEDGMTMDIYFTRD